VLVRLRGSRFSGAHGRRTICAGETAAAGRPHLGRQPDWEKPQHLASFAARARFFSAGSAGRQGLLPISRGRSAGPSPMALLRGPGVGVDEGTGTPMVTVNTSEAEGVVVKPVPCSAPNFALVGFCRCTQPSFEMLEGGWSICFPATPPSRCGFRQTEATNVEKPVAPLRHGSDGVGRVRTAALGRQADMLPGLPPLSRSRGTFRPSGPASYGFRRRADSR